MGVMKMSVSGSVGLVGEDVFCLPCWKCSIAATELFDWEDGRWLRSFFVEGSV